MFVILFLAFLGGLLTILSPCILPVLPFIFSGAGRPFSKSGFPLLLGMALTFTGVSALAVAGGGWVAHANQWGRYAALVLLSFFALTLLLPSLAEIATRPFLRLGGRLQGSGFGEEGPGRSFLLGIATGFLWAPCAGPILGLLLTSAALRSASSGIGLLLAYALGAATSLSLAIWGGNRVLGVLRRYLQADLWIRRALGILVLLGVAAIALGWDRGVLTRLSRVRTEVWEQNLLQRFSPSLETPTPQNNEMPELKGANAWINSPSLTRQALRGKVVLIDFWTYSCINCLRTLPYVKAWDEKYRKDGLVIIGVHTPEFAFEKNLANVQKAVQELGITYPVAVDNDYAIWNAFQNHYWPAHYFIDASGKIRQHHFGEGEYEESEVTIQRLLGEVASARALPSGFVQAHGQGPQAASTVNAESPETYIGYARAENQAQTKPVEHDHETTYTVQPKLILNQWGLEGRWIVRGEHAELTGAPGKLTFRFRARDLHLVMGPGTSKKPLRFRVRLDGHPPATDRGTDINKQGEGLVQEERLYQLIRQGSRGAEDHTFQIEFLDPGVRAFAFTFG